MTALKSFGLHFGVLLLGVVIFFVQGPSFVHHLAERLPDAGDSLLNCWILAWDAHALTTHDVNIWDAPIFYPARNTLTFSETMFGNLWLTVPVELLTGNPILAYNALVLVSFVLGMYCTFLLVRALTSSFGAGVLAGILFSFNPQRWSEVPHVQLLPFFWAPLALLLVHRCLEKPRAWTLLAVFATIVAQYYTSLYLGTMLLVMSGLFVAIQLIEEDGRKNCLAVLTDRRLQKVFLAGSALAALLALLPLALPYWRTIQDWDFVRTQADEASFSCELASFVVPQESFRSYHWLRHLLGGHFRGCGGLGVLPWLLAVGGILVGRRQPVVRRFAWTALAMALLMLGPCLIFFNRQYPLPLPYFLVHHLIPGSKALRAPSRFVLPLLLCLAVLAGFAIARVLRALQRTGPSIRVLVAAPLLGFLCVDYAVSDNPGIPLERGDALPPVYRYLQTCEGDRPVLELPPTLGAQFRYLYYQTTHWQPLLGGESGNVTPAAQEMSRRIQGGPTPQVLRLLALTPAATLVVHLNAYPVEAEREAWRAADLGAYGFRPVGQFGEALVWQRACPLPPSASKLRVLQSRVAISHGLSGDRFDLSLVVTPAGKDLPWRFLERGFGEVIIEIVDADGVQRSLKSVAVPPYLLPGEQARIKLERIRGSFAGAHSARISGLLLEPCEIKATP
jgi:hypothetical protein